MGAESLLGIIAFYGIIMENNIIIINIRKSIQNRTDKDPRNIKHLYTNLIIRKYQD